MTERIEELWQTLIDKDDRNSPEEYPEMALITFDEFAEVFREGASAPSQRPIWCRSTTAHCAHPDCTCPSPSQPQPAGEREQTIEWVVCCGSAGIAPNPVFDNEADALDRYRKEIAIPSYFGEGHKRRARVIKRMILTEDVTPTRADALSTPSQPVGEKVSRIWNDWLTYYERHFRGAGIALSMADQQAFHEIADRVLRGKIPEEWQQAAYDQERSEDGYAPSQPVGEDVQGTVPLSSYKEVVGYFNAVRKERDRFYDELAEERRLRAPVGEDVRELVHRLCEDHTILLREREEPPHILGSKEIHALTKDVLDAATQLDRLSRLRAQDAESRNNAQRIIERAAVLIDSPEYKTELETVKARAEALAQQRDHECKRANQFAAFIRETDQAEAYHNWESK